MSENESLLPGERLRRAREKKGLSQEEASRHLRLSNSYMRALENDDYGRLPEATFIKGYLRNYARFLGLPAEELARQFQQYLDTERQEQPEEHQQADLEDEPRRQGWRLPALVVLVVVLIAALGWWLWPHQQPAAVDIDDSGRAGEESVDSALSPAKSEPVAPQSTSPSAPVESNLEGPELQVRDSDPDPDGDAPQLANDSEPVSSMERVEQPEQLEQLESTTASAGDDAADSIRMAFSRVCWIKVVDATGATLSQGQQDAGGSVSLDGEAPFRVTLGDAAAVSAVHINGSAVSLPSQRSGDVVRVTLP